MNYVKDIHSSTRTDKSRLGWIKLRRSGGLFRRLCIGVSLLTSGLCVGFSATVFTVAENLAANRPVRASSVHADWQVENAVDGRVSTESRWVSDGGDRAPHWLEVELDGRAEIASAHIYTGWGSEDPIVDFDLQAWSRGEWRTVEGGSVRGNDATALAVTFVSPVLTDRFRLLVHDRDHARLKELSIFGRQDSGTPALGTAVEGFQNIQTPPPIYLNQSGFDPDRPKRFTMPSAGDGTPFVVRQLGPDKIVYRGTIQNHVGDFSDFRPDNPYGKYVVEAADQRSVSFGIGLYWVERATYQLAMDFMIESRHYVGDVTETRRLSYAWRDNHQFAFEAQTLVAQYLSNPSAYDRMPRKIVYVGPDERKAWGALEPYAEDAPDIVKLIHWSADVIVTRRLTHAMKKGQLAAFLYAYPYMSAYIPESAYQQVLALALELWENDTADHGYPYNETRHHNMLALDTTIGSTKGAHPPGHTIAPNLYMYEVALRERLENPEVFFDAAYRQAEWIIDNFDWQDPQTTKGQRMSEHVTPTALVTFALKHPDRAPAGLREKLEDWARIMVSRSDNMWDFRRLSEDQWVPTGAAVTAWNEPGNVAGFAACALSVAYVIEDSELRGEMERLAVSHIDNMFGRNPTGRHFSHRAPDEVEGVEHGWYSYHVGGVGALEEVAFVLEGAPKEEHYPYNPEIGDIGWTEGWVNFNTAYNMSLAMMAMYDTELELFDAEFSEALTTVRPGDRVGVRLRAPLNFDYHHVEEARVQVIGPSGEQAVAVVETSVNSRYFEGVFTIDAEAGDEFTIAYGFGWLAAKTNLDVGERIVRDDEPTAATFIYE